MLKAETAAMIMMSGTPDLENITLTENGVYQSVDHDGFNIVTVDTPYGQCAEEVAEMLDIDTSQDWDCDDIKDKITELQNELDACHDCKDDVVAAIRQYDPSYVLPASGCPDNGIGDVYNVGYNAGRASVALDTKTILHNGTYAASAESPPLDGFSEVTVSVPLGAKFITANGTYLPASDNLDGYNSVVVDVQSCGCYTFPPDVGFEQVMPVIGTDLLYPEGNTYHFRYYIQDRTYGEPYVDRNIMTKILGPQTGEPYKDIRLLFEIYDNSGTMVSQQIIGNSQDYYIYENDDYFMVTSTSMSYGSTKAFNYTFEYTYHNYYGQQTVTESGSVDLSDYIDTTTQNPSYTVKSNS